MSADNGELKPGSRAAEPTPSSADGASEREGADDLDALASGLGSLLPAAEPDEAGDDESNLATLAALSARGTKESLASEAARVSLESSAAPGGSVAPAQSAAAPARAGWVIPLFLGLGLGVGIAGAMFGLSPRPTSDPSPAAAAATLDSPRVPGTAQASAAPSPAAEPAAPAAAAPASAASPTAPASSVSSPQPVAPGGRAATNPLHARPAAGEAPATAAAGPTPGSQVLSVRPAEPEPAAAEADQDDAPAQAAPTSMDTLLDEALSPEARRQELQEKKRIQIEEQKIPLTPSRQDVTQALTVLLPAIRGCAMGHSGQAIAAIVVHADGRVASAEIAGAPFAGTASGRCMEGVIRRARFPRFSQAAFRVRFPLAIQ